MILSFKCKYTELLFYNKDVKKFRDFEKQVRIKLKYLNSAHCLKDLKIPISNRLEKLQGNRKSQYSIRINKQWRICFEWYNGNVSNVEIVDYH